MKTRLVIVRHGKTIFNEQGIMQGQADSDLSEEGKKQAQQLARRLASLGIDRVYSSDLGRCKQTLKPFLASKDLPVTFTQKLRERSYGIFDGKHKDKFRQWASESGYYNDYTFSIPKGESFPKVQDRMEEAVQEILNKEEGKTVLIVTHGGAKTSLLLRLFKEQRTNETYAKYKPGNTAVTILDFDSKGNVTLHTLNSEEHLEE